MAGERQVTFRRRLGENAPDLIANLVVSGTIPAILELVSNAYDADAKDVEIAYLPEVDELQIADNGSGMAGEEEIDAFFRLGDSPKEEEPISPGGRRRIGKFGIASVLVNALCRDYTLKTWRDGRRTTIRETLEGKISSQKDIGGIEEKIGDPDSHGTEIAMTNLKFSEDSNFSLGELKRRIAWEIPLLPDFRVMVNGSKVKSKSIENATVFGMDTIDEEAGEIKGKLYLTKQSTKMAGIHVYVNGRRVGDPKALLDRTVDSMTLQNRVVGIIHADGLEEAILFDRGRFGEDHPSVVKMERTVKKALRQMKTYLDGNRRAIRSQNIHSARSVLLKKVAESVISSDFERVDKDTGFGFAKDLDPNIPGLYDSEENRVIVNPESAALTIAATTTTPQYERALLTAIVDTLARDSAIIGSESEEPTMTDFLRKRQEIWAKVSGKTFKEEKRKASLYPTVFYQPIELSKTSERSIGAIRRAIEAGLLNQTEDGIKGGDFMEFEEGTKGLVPLYDLVREELGISAVAITLERYHKILADAGESVRPFLYNISRNENPLFFLEGSFRTRVFEIFNSELTDQRRVDYNPGDAFNQLGETYLTIPQISAESDNLTTTEISRVLAYSRENRSLAVPMKKQGRGATFRLGNFVTALQTKRGNNGYSPR